MQTTRAHYILLRRTGLNPDVVVRCSVRRSEINEKRRACKGVKTIIFVWETGGFFLTLEIAESTVRKKTAIDDDAPRLDRVHVPLCDRRPPPETGTDRARTRRSGRGGEGKALAMCIQFAIGLPVGASHCGRVILHFRKQTNRRDCGQEFPDGDCTIPL
jgi:hypothetical protein